VRKNQRVIHLPGETVTERPAKRWYKRERDYDFLKETEVSEKKGVLEIRVNR
jgi:hypothetical protein